MSSRSPIYLRDLNKEQQNLWLSRWAKKKPQLVKDHADGVDIEIGEYFDDDNCRAV